MTSDDFDTRERAWLTTFEHFAVLTQERPGAQNSVTRAVIHSPRQASSLVIGPYEAASPAARLALIDGEYSITVGPCDYRFDAETLTLISIDATENAPASPVTD